MTAQTPDIDELVGELADALGSAGLDAGATGRTLLVDGIRHPIEVVARAHPTAADLRELVRTADDGGGVGDGGREPSAAPDSRPPGDESVPGPTARVRVVAADRLSEPAREVLRDAGWGWLDRRGHVRIWAPGLRVELPFAGTGGRSVRSNANPWTPVGLDVVLAMLVDPSAPASARRIAAIVGRSVGATHEALARFAAIGLVGPQTRLPLMPDLFWEAASHWPDGGWVQLPVDLHAIAERVGGESVIRVDERAATLGGARIAAASSLPARAYLVGSVALRRARTLTGTGGADVTYVRAAPTSWLPDNPEFAPDEARPWRVAHPIICALRLAADPARGKEIVEDWGIVGG